MRHTHIRREPARHRPRVIEIASRCGSAYIRPLFVQPGGQVDVSVDQWVTLGDGGGLLMQVGGHGG